MQLSTAAAKSGRILRILSSDFGDLFEKLSHASYRIAAGEVDPGLNTESVEVGTFWIRSQTSEPIMRTQSSSPTA